MIVSIFVVLFGLLFLGVPIWASISAAAFSALVFNPNLAADFAYCFRTMVTSLNVYSILAVPLFVLSGMIMARGGISKKLFDFFAYFIGKMPGGMPSAIVVTCLFYGAISGSGPATVAAVGAMTIPLLVDLGYNKVWVTALVTTAGGLGVIIPPSVPFIMYGLSSGESVGSLFIAGILPGLLIGAFLIVYCVVYFTRHGEDKERLNANYDEIHSKGFWALIKDSFWALLTPVIILGGIYGGVITPTEAAGISVVYAFVVSKFVYKTYDWKDVAGSLRETIKTNTPIMLVVAGATLLGRMLTMLQAPQKISSAIISLSDDRIVILLIINLFLLVVGMLLDTGAAILLFTPILLPIATAVGVDPIHLGVIMIVNLAIGFVTPPVGVNLYVAAGMTQIPVMKIAKQAIPFMLVFFVALLVITYVPEVSLLLVQ